MNVLLDTHALLWFLLDDPALSASAKACIEFKDRRVFVSPASYWEIAIKISLGKYRLDETLDGFLERELIHNDFLVLPIRIAHAAKLTDMPFHHRDPFDRLMIAQALTDAMPIVSADVAFDNYGIQRIW